MRGICQQANIEFFGQKHYVFDLVQLVYKQK